MNTSFSTLGADEGPIDGEPSPVLLNYPTKVNRYPLIEVGFTKNVSIRGTI